MSVTAYYFWSPACVYCKDVKPIIADLKDDFDTVLWIYVNTQDDPNNYAQVLNVKTLPTVVVLAKDSAGNTIYTDHHSGREASGYFRILRTATKY